MAPPVLFVVFGITGDLAHRKLVPALLEMNRTGALPPGSRVVGIGRRDYTRDEVLTGLESSSREALENHWPGERAWLEFASRFTYLRGDFCDGDVYRRLRAEHVDVPGAPRDCVFFLASGPDRFIPVARGLASVGLGTAGRETEDSSPFRRLLVEKPFGTDRASAHVLNRALHECFAEPDIFRVDHYLGKEAVQNLIYFRFANSVFEPLWNRNYVNRVEIDAFETVGIGGRGDFYDSTGAARDMLQNHLIQLLCLTAMEAPASLDPESIREEKVKVLKSIPDYDLRTLAARSRRGQYAAGRLPDGAWLPDYVAEERVSPASTTETYVSLELEVDNWRFAGVPFVLRTGKALDRRRSEIAIHFRQPPETLFADVMAEAISEHGIPPNTLTVRIQPNEGIWLSFNAKVPGEAAITRSELRFDYGDARESAKGPDAYRRLLSDALSGDSTLFIRFDETEEAWRLVDAMRASWESESVPLLRYPAGSAAPL